MKRIAITQRVLTTTEHQDICDSLSQEWQTWLTKLLPESVLLALPNQLTSVEQWWSEVNPDILVLSGGNDWGESRGRDETETRAVALARASRTPILGVCRGLQALNIIFGGQVVQDLNSITKTRHVATTHSVSIIVESMSEYFGTGRIEVNSYHSQGVVLSGLAKEFIAFAVSDGMVVEGMYHSKEPILAVQWHPERFGPNNDWDSSLLNYFLDTYDPTA